ncbi:hypothetical protein RZS28_00335 [Methylocapsa polymorpha]|uniref:Uncharacterized protein n=1 Tax=Methylocapsa polymorpha TaxID=3080828 RepID=A0ABZ0HR75_9HYPH|nr:hypothetical protein RZS28_00335 [Methylocapsa sp. RX1]
MSLFEAPVALHDAEARYGAEPEMIYVLIGGLALAGVAFAFLMTFAA